MRASSSASDDSSAARSAATRSRSSARSCADCASSASRRAASAAYCGFELGKLARARCRLGAEFLEREFARVDIRCAARASSASSVRRAQPRRALPLSSALEAPPACASRSARRVALAAQIAERFRDRATRAMRGDSAARGAPAFRVRECARSSLRDQVADADARSARSARAGASTRSCATEKLIDAGGLFEKARRSVGFSAGSRRSGLARRSRTNRARSPCPSTDP